MMSQHGRHGYVLWILLNLLLNFEYYSRSEEKLRIEHHANSLKHQKLFEALKDDSLIRPVERILNLGFDTNPINNGIKSQL